MEGQAGRDTQESRSVQARPGYGGEAVRIDEGQVKHTADLGIEGGSTTDRIGILTDDSVLNESQRQTVEKARQTAKDYGIDAVFFYGGNLNINGVEARGYYDGKRIYVRADHVKYSADQLTRHEIGHDMIAKGTVDVKAVRDKIKKLNIDTDAMAAEYIKAYEDNGAGMTAEAIWHEIICDSLGDMNEFESFAFKDTMRTWQSEVKEVAKQNAGENKGKTARADNSIGGKHSKEIKTDGERRLSDTRAERSAERPATRTESRSSFYDRNSDKASRIRRADTSAYWASPSNLRGWNNQEKKLKAQKVNCFVCSELQVNRNGVTYLYKGNSSGYVEIGKEHATYAIFDSETVPKENTLAQIIYLATKNSDVYSVIDANLDHRSDEFAELYMDVVGVNPGIENSYERTTEKAYAKICGELAAGENDVFYNNLLKDADAVRDAVDNMVDSFMGESDELSMSEPVEETKTLIAMHNLSEESLRAALKLGGLPSPSIAIVKADDGHTKYGDVSVVFSKNSIDPEADSRNKVYGGDAWTPTSENAPVEYKVDNDARREFDDNIYELAKDIAGGVFAKTGTLRSRGIEDSTEKTVERIAENIYNKDEIRAAYLSSIGKNIEPVYKTKSYGRLGNDFYQKCIDHFGVQQLAKLYADIETRSGITSETINEVRQLYEQHLLDTYSERYAAKENGAQLAEKHAKRMAADLWEAQIERAIEAAWDMYEEGGGKATEIDRYATSDKLKAAVDDETVKAWVTDMLQGVIGEAGIYNGRDPIKANGTRRSFDELHEPYTLDNIVNSMNRADAKGANALGLTAEILHAVANTNFNNISEMHGEENRLYTENAQDYKNRFVELDEHLSEVLDEIKASGKNVASIDAAASALKAAAFAKRTQAAVKSVFAKNGFNISSALAHNILDLFGEAAEIPTGYFEAKPQRAIKFDEPLAVVVPEGLSADIKSELVNQGANVLEYENNNDADRLEKINSIKDVRFSRELSLGTDSEGRELSDQQKEYFANSKVTTNDGALKVMYRGGNADFTVFDKKKSNPGNLYGRGFYFTDSKEHASQYGNVKEYYLNIEQPLTPGTKEITKSQMRKFLNAVKENEDDYSFENYGYNASVAKVLNSVYGKDDFSMLQDVNASAIGDFVETIRLFNEVNSTSYDGIITPTETVTFKSEQAKSVTNKEPTTNPDIRFSRELKSLQELDAANRETKKLLSETRKQLKSAMSKAEYWEGQTKLTTSPTARQGDITKLAKSLIKEMGSDIKAEDISSDLKQLTEFIWSNLDASDSEAYPVVKGWADKIASDIVNSAQVIKDDVNAELYSGIKSYLRDTKMSISRVDSHDIADYAAWRKGVFGKINVKIDGEGISVDQAYQELNEMAPWLFPEDVTHPADMLLQMEQALSEMQPVYENPYSYNMAEAIEYTSNQILGSVMSDAIRRTAPTFADKAEAKLQKQHSADMAKLEQERKNSAERIDKLKKYYQAQREAALKRVRQKRDEQISQLKTEHKKMQETARQRKADSEARTRLLNIARRLQNKKLPQVTRAMLDSYIGQLDTVAKGITEKGLADLRAIRDYYYEKTTPNSDKYDPNWRASEEIKAKLERLDKIERNGGTIADMNIDDVLELTRILLNIENQIQTANKLQNSEERRNVYQAGIETINNIENAAGMTKISERFFYRSLSPERFARRIVGYVDGSIKGTTADPLVTCVKEMTRGEEAFDMYQRDARKLFGTLLSDSEFMRSLYGKHAKSAEVTGIDARTGKAKTIKITRAQLIDLYCNLNNDDNLDHLEFGGGVFLEYEALKNGDKELAERHATTLKLKKTDIQAATAKLTDKERAFARGLHNYYNDYAPKRLNETSLTLDGYERFLVDNYYPISVDSDFLTMNFEAMATVTDGNVSLANPGFAQERVSSKKPIYIVNANERLVSSVVKNGRYATMAVPLSNMSKLLNMQMASWDTTRENTTVKKTINTAYGSKVFDYLNTYMRQYAGHSLRTSNSVDALLEKVRSQYSGGVLLLGAGTAIKQAASYPTAAAVVSALSLTEAFSPAKINLDYIDKMTAVYTKRADGFSSLEVAELTQQGKHIPKGLNWIQAMDLGTTKLLKRAAFFEVKNTRKDLKLNSNEFKQAVVDMYIKIIEETQPNYSTALRPDVLRSENSLERTLVMFATQPLQNFNILYDAQQNYAAKLRAAKVAPNDLNVQAAKKAAGKQFAKAIGSQAVSSLVFAAMQMFWDFIREKDDKYKDKNGEWSVLSALKGLGINMLANGVGMIPFAKPALELVESLTDGVLKIMGKDAFFEQSFYGWEAAPVSAITDSGTSAVAAILSAIDAIVKAADGNDETTPDWEKAIRNCAKAIEDFSVLIGLPAGNVKQLIRVLGFKSIRALVSDDYEAEYYINKWAGVSNAEYYDNLWKAYTNDYDSYLNLRAIMVEDSKLFTDSERFKDSKLTSEMKSRIKKAYADGSISEDKTIEYLTRDFLNDDKEPMSKNDAWLQLQKWNDPNGNNSQYSAMYSNFDAAAQAGKYDVIRGAIAEYRIHGVTDKQLKSSVGSHYKELYIAANSTERSRIYRIMLATGLYSADDLKKLYANWLEPKN